MPPEDKGPELARFEADPARERSLSRFRAATALVAALASGLLLLGDLPVPVFLVALLGLLISLVWLSQARTTAQRATHAGREFLALYRDGLLLAKAKQRTWVPWDMVEEVAVDEERLDVVVTRRNAPPLRIEPHYPGVEIHELVRTLRNALRHGED